MFQHSLFAGIVPPEPGVSNVLKARTLTAWYIYFLGIIACREVDCIGI